MNNNPVSASTPVDTTPRLENSATPRIRVSISVTLLGFMVFTIGERCHLGFVHRITEGDIAGGGDGRVAAYDCSNLAGKFVGTDMATNERREGVIHYPLSEVKR